MSLKTWVVGERVFEADLNANFAEVALPGYLTAVAGEAISAKDAVCAGYYQADGGIIFDALAEKHGQLTTAGGTVTQSFTVGNHTNRVLLVAVATSQSVTIDTATFNGDAMTQITEESFSSGTSKLVTFALFAPDVITADFSVNIGGAAGSINYALVVYSYYNVTQSIDSSADMNNDSGNMTLTVTPSTDGALIWSVFADNATETIASVVNCGSNISNNASNKSMRAGDSGFVYPRKATVISADTNDYGAQASICLTPITAPTLSVVLKADASALANACNLNKAEHFIGFAQEAASAGENIVVQLSGKVTGLSGLSPFYTYYLSNTDGAIATSAGTVSKKVGVAISTTELVIKHDNT